MQPTRVVGASSRVLTALAIVGFCSGSVAAQKSAGPAAGTLIVDGGGATESVVRRFVEVAGGRRAQIVVFATGPSSIRFGDQNIILDPDWPRDRKEWSQYEEYLKDSLAVDAIRVLHTRDRNIANTEAFVAPLKSATGVYLSRRKCRPVRGRLSGYTHPRGTDGGPCSGRCDPRKFCRRYYPRLFCNPRTS